jgi:hypothetical protein
VLSLSGRRLLTLWLAGADVDLLNRASRASRFAAAAAHEPYFDLDRIRRLIHLIGAPQCGLAGMVRVSRY